MPDTSPANLTSERYAEIFGSGLGCLFRFICVNLFITSRPNNYKLKHVIPSQSQLVDLTANIFTNRPAMPASGAIFTTATAEFIAFLKFFNGCINRPCIAFDGLKIA